MWAVGLLIVAVLVSEASSVPVDRSSANKDDFFLTVKRQFDPVMSSAVSGNYRYRYGNGEGPTGSRYRRPKVSSGRSLRHEDPKRYGDILGTSYGKNNDDNSNGWPH